MKTKTKLKLELTTEAAQVVRQLYEDGELAEVGVVDLQEADDAEQDVHDTEPSETSSRSFTIISEAEAQSEKAKEDAKRLEGAWNVTALTKNGKPIPQSDLKGLQVRFHGHEANLLRDEASIFVAAYRIDPSKSPAMVDLISADFQIFEVGIYKLEGDTLTTAFDDNVKLGRPTIFEAKAGDNIEVTIFKRAK